MKKWMKNSKWLIGLLVVGLLFLAPFRCGKVPPEVKYIEKTDTWLVSDTVQVVDTFKIYNPVPKYIEIVKTDTFYNEKGDTIPLFTQTKTYRDTVKCAQNDTAIVTNTIQGINANLLSTEVELRKQEITNTITIEKIIKQKPKKWGVGVGIGYGIGLKNKDFEPFLGVSINYNF